MKNRINMSDVKELMESYFGCGVEIYGDGRWREFRTEIGDVGRIDLEGCAVYAYKNMMRIFTINPKTKEIEKDLK